MRPRRPPGGPWLLAMAAIAALAAGGGTALATPAPKAARALGTIPAGAKAKAQLFYAQNCANCHGNTGRGDGPVAAPEIWSTIEGTDLTRKPRNFVDDPLLWGETPERVAATIKAGIPGTAMSGFAELLDDQETRAIAEIVLRLRAEGRRPKP